MVSWIAISFASAHPPPPARSTGPDDGVAAVFAGPSGCFRAEALTTWSHGSGAWRTAGRARVRWRADGGVWHAEAFVLETADPASLEVRTAPMLFGRLVAAPLAYPTTPDRWVSWPAPVATLPTRSFGQIDTVSSDERPDGSRSVVVTFVWRGWKEVSGARTVTFDPSGVPVRAGMDVTDRWRGGCTVRSVGEAVIGPHGLPTTERWTLDGRCPLRRWTGEWTFAFTDWGRCEVATVPSPSGAEPGVY
ncbi:MAG: hypothetical protein ABMA64_03225 [Myxococcota bacterium]